MEENLEEKVEIKGEGGRSILLTERKFDPEPSMVWKEINGFPPADNSDNCGIHNDCGYG